MILNAWAWWVRRCNAPFDNRLLALTRILLALCVLLDLASLGAVGLLPDYFVLIDHGGYTVGSHDAFAFAGWGPEVGPALVAVTMTCMTLVALGLVVRPATVLGVLAYAQLGMLQPAGDRAVDRIVRTVLLVLVFSQAHRCYALGNVLRRRARVAVTTSAIPLALRLLLVLVYMSAGVTKVSAQGWLKLTGEPQLYRIVTDPTYARINPDLPILRRLFPLFRVGSVGTLLLELGAPVLLTRWMPYWAIFGALMHVGIALMLKLGMFSWGMLSLYPLLFAPWLTPLLDRLEAGRARPVAPEVAAGR